MKYSVDIFLGIEEYELSLLEPEKPANSEIIAEGIAMLEHYWKEVYGTTLPSFTFSLLPLVAECLNLAAKIWDGAFYDMKPRFIDAIIEAHGDSWSYGWDDGVFYIESMEVGVVCFHDPYGEIESAGQWNARWSGIRRQNLAHEALRNPTVRRVLAEGTKTNGRLFGVSNGCIERIVNRLLNG